MKLPYANNVNYYKTGQSSPDTLITRACVLIENAGGVIRQHMIGMVDGREGVLVAFNLDEDFFRIEWPVLPSSARNPQTDLIARRRQAATFLYYEVKARCVAAKVLGGRTSFMSYLVLPNGVSMAELSTPEIHAAMPKMLPQGE